MTNLKELMEKRNELFQESDEILSAVEKEERSAVSNDEATRLNEIKSEIDGINATIDALESQTKNENQVEERSVENNKQKEIRGVGH